jgi:2-hydroxychromene-2-carboxylate isomerase
MKRRVPRFFFSFRSPYSWLAARQIEERWPSIVPQLEYIPFWEPDAYSLELLSARGGEFFYTPMSHQKHLYILQDIKRLVNKFGYQNAWPVDHNPWWELPHLAYLVARRMDKGHEFLWAVYRARWERGENICSADVIQRLGQEVGLDSEALVSAPDNPEIRAEGIDALYRIYQDSVFGVPFFSYGFEKFWGLDRLEDFVARLQAT